MEHHHGTQVRGPGLSIIMEHRSETRPVHHHGTQVRDQDCPSSWNTGQGPGLSIIMEHRSGTRPVHHHGTQVRDQDCPSSWNTGQGPGLSIIMEHRSGTRPVHHHGTQVRDQDCPSFCVFRWVVICFQVAGLFPHSSATSLAKWLRRPPPKSNMFEFDSRFCRGCFFVGRVVSVT